MKNDNPRFILLYDSKWWRINWVSLTLVGFSNESEDGRKSRLINTKYLRIDFNTTKL